jgi:hypothetical protein
VTYLCKVTVPPGTPPAAYGMQAVAYSADRDPGETSVTSKRVGITVPEKEEENGGLPWWVFLIVGLVVLAVIVVVAMLVFGGDDGLQNDEPPTIDGTPEVLQILTASTGTWSLDDNDLVFSFQWERCNEDGEECEAIQDAIQPTYQLGADDLAQRVLVEVTATNEDDEGDSATARSEPTDEVAPAQVQPVAVPQVAGVLNRDEASALLQQNFTVSVGTAGDPIFNCNPPVEDQVPDAGTVLDPGELVVITTRPQDPSLFCVFFPGILVDQSRGPRWR